MKPANFPARKAARQRNAADRRLPQLQSKTDLRDDLIVEAKVVHGNFFLYPQEKRDVRTKKNRSGVRF